MAHSPGKLSGSNPGSPAVSIKGEDLCDSEERDTYIDVLSDGGSRSSSPDHRSPTPPLLPPPLKLTNFFIEDILKPEFGRRTDVKKCVQITNFNSRLIEQKNRLNEHRTSGSDRSCGEEEERDRTEAGMVWPAWVYCTRYSDRPSSGPRSRKLKKTKERKQDEKRPRTAFTNEQLQRLKKEFDENRYLTEQRRQDLANELKLNESQIKIWFQNKRAKMKKASGVRGGLALHLMAQGLYNHTSMGGENQDTRLKSP